MFSYPLLSIIHNSQDIFRTWFDEWLIFQSVNDNVDQNVDDTLIINAPAYDPLLFLPPAVINDMKIRRNESWIIQDATAYVLQQYLSKKYTLRKWSIGLDERLLTTNKKIFFTPPSKHDYLRVERLLIISSIDRIHL
ncbi:unnamed protein product [Rotaria sp. Silwood2]|nr:unnamed protein product [Rotaria sp. Silwood2]